MKLINPKVGAVVRKNISHSEMMRILKLRKQKKCGFKDFAIEVEQMDDNVYNVYIEYVY